MPHLTLEYTANLQGFDARKVLLTLNQTLVASGQFEERDIKSRAIPLETFVIGTTPGDRSFVHVVLAILSGRTDETKRQISESLLQILNKVVEQPTDSHLQLCVEIQEIHRASYAKASIGRS